MTEAQYPVVEQIAQIVVARLEQLTVANGYKHDIADVVRPTVEGGYSPENLLAVVEQGDAEREKDHDYEGNPNRIAWGQPFVITLFVNASNKAAVPEDQLVNVFEADAIKALTAPDRWEHFPDSGPDLAFEAEFRSPKRILTSDGAYAGTEVHLVVHYRHPENDPYTVG